MFASFSDHSQTLSTFHEVFRRFRDREVNLNAELQPHRRIIDTQVQISSRTPRNTRSERKHLVCLGFLSMSRFRSFHGCHIIASSWKYRSVTLRPATPWNFAVSINFEWICLKTMILSCHSNQTCTFRIDLHPKLTENSETEKTAQGNGWKVRRSASASLGKEKHTKTVRVLSQPKKGRFRAGRFWLEFVSPNDLSNWQQKCFFR